MVIMEHPFEEDKEIEKRLDEDHKISEAMERRYLARPTSARRYITRWEYVMLKRKFDRTCRIVDANKELIAAHENRISSLESQSRKLSLDGAMRAISDRNVTHIRKIFALPEIKGTEKVVVSDLSEMLSEYSDKDIDSVELLRGSRDD